jgi:outer membrane protein assembly factor BamB
LINKSLAVGIIFLFIVSSTTPMVIGYDAETVDGEPMDDYAFDRVNIYQRSELFDYETYFCWDYDGDFNSRVLNVSNGTDEIESDEPVNEVLTGTVDGSMDSPWPMKCHDTRHTGCSPYSTADNHGTEKWRFRTDYWVEGGAVICDDGTIYFGGFNYYLHALYPNGTLKWKYKTGEWIWSTPAIAEDGTIYVTSYDANLYAINPDGTLKWKKSGGASITSSPAIGDDGTIYFGSMTGGSGHRIWAINPDGTEKWHYTTGNFIASDPAIGDDGTVYIGSADGYLYAMYPNGTLRWRFKTGDRIKSHPSIAEDGTIYISSFDHYLYALYPNGTMKWKYGNCYGGCSSASIDIDGTIYVGGNKLYAIYPDGTLKWSFNFGDDRRVDHSSPAISADGTIYVGVCIGEVSGGEIIAVNPDGTEKWRKKIATLWVDSSPCIGEDGTVYIGSSSEDVSDSYGYLHAFVTGYNNPPDKPTITGPSSGKIGAVYNYTFVATDPDGSDIYLYIDWDDYGSSGWIGPYASGEEVTLSHTWNEMGIYTIKAKAKDTYYDSESDWTTLKVTMPKNKTINTPFLNFLKIIHVCSHCYGNCWGCKIVYNNPFFSFLNVLPCSRTYGWILTRYTVVH